jgi:hypothetical protein
MLERERIAEPWASFGDQVGLPSAWLAVQTRSDAREQAAERREREARLERAEDRRERALWVEYQRALVEGREGVDPSRPETFVLGPDQLAARVFAAQDAEAARNGRRVLMEAGLAHDLRLPISEMGTPPPSREQRAEMETTRARYPHRARECGGEDPAGAAGEGDGMTAGKAEDAAAASAKAQAEAFAEQRATVSERQARETNGSDVEVSQAGWTPPSVAWPSPSTAGQPPVVSPQPTPSPNVTDPRDIRQSQ